MTQERTLDEKKAGLRKPDTTTEAPEKQPPASPSPEVAAVLHLQQQVGNRAVQRLLQRQGGEEGFTLDEETAGRINQARGSGQALDSSIQKQMGESMGHDFSGVRVHTSAEAHDLNQQLSAKAFTTGQDIFFRQGSYDPGSSGGQELIAHELTHVVQQSSGLVSGGGRMTVRPAGDAYEQEADAIARGAAGSDTSVQRQEVPEEEEVQTAALQRQEVPEEEELQTQALPHTAVGLTQRQEELPEEEEIQTAALPHTAVGLTQRQEELPEEEELQTAALPHIAVGLTQRQEELPEEEI
jgi:hypothetical protein